jgi:hypothetical protein
VHEREETVEFRYVPPPYSPAHGITVDWERGFEIDLRVVEGEVLLRANPAGLVSLAKQLLTLAQQGVPAGSHIHYDPGEELEDDSVPLILERG